MDINENKAVYSGIKKSRYSNAGNRLVAVTHSTGKVHCKILEMGCGQVWTSYDKGRHTVEART